MSSSKKVQQTITPKISGHFIIRVAELYTDFNRAIMEYVDNSIDSAEAYFNENKNSYEQEINISITIENTQKKITIQDNCEGVESLDALIHEIGNSDKKKGDFTTTNGQFGFGIYSFMAGCGNIEFYSKYKNHINGYYLKIKKEDFDQTKLNDVRIDASRQAKNIGQGTQVILSGFSKNIWQEISLDDVKKEISDHFDCLLRRKKFTVTVNEDKIVAYDYDDIEGDTWEEEIKEAEYTRKRQGQSSLRNITFTKPIKIFLKMSDKVEVKRPPVFIVKGRKINDIRSIKGFKSHYGSKNMLWGHSQITGYVDLKDNFEPTIKRDDFKDIRKDEFRAFNQKLNELEQLIYEAFITDKNKEKADNTFNNLASKISDLINSLDKEDGLQLKQLNVSKDGEGDGHPFEEGLGSKDRGEGENAGKGSNIGTNEGDGLGVNVDKDGDDVFFDTQNPKKKSGLNISFTDDELIQLENSDNYLRSQLSEDVNGKTIKIYKKHNDFKSRVKTSKKGEIKITETLLNYISCEIAIHYKDELYSKSGNMPDKYEKEIFRDITNLIYKIEEKLNPLKEQSLNVLNN